jgi:hypothetical protein
MICTHKAARWFALAAVFPLAVVLALGGALGGTAHAGSLIAHWKLDEAAGANTAADETGNYPGTNSDATNMPGQTGQIDGAYYFDGTGDNSATGAFLTEFGGASWTVSAWVNTTQANGTLLSKCSGDSNWGDPEKKWYIYNGVPYMVGYWADWITGTTIVNDGTWHHIAYTWDWNTTTPKVYVDGTDCTSTASYNGRADNAGHTVRLGWNPGGDGAAHFDGYLDDVRIYNFALDAAAVDDLYNAGLGQSAPTITSAAPPDAVKDVAYSHTFTATGNPETFTWSMSGADEAKLTAIGLTWTAGTATISDTPTAAGTATDVTVTCSNGVGTDDTQTFTIDVSDIPAGLVAWYTFDNSGDPGHDDTGNGHNATAITATWTADGKLDGAMSFAGQYVDVADSVDLRFAWNDDYSISTWVYLDSVGGWRGVVTKSRDASPWYGLWTNNATWHTPNWNAGTVTTGEWLHVVVVQNSTTNLRYIYVNTVEVGSGSPSDGTGTGVLRLGGAAGTGEYTYGRLDDVRIYNIALDTDDIAALYAMGTAAPEINVQGLSQDIADGSTTPAASNDTDFGSTSVGTPVTHQFTIQNTGTALLTLGGTAVSISGAGAAAYSVTAQPATTVAASGSTTFDVEFNPASEATFAATITITNDDADESPYNFDITGTGSNVPANLVAWYKLDETVAGPAVNSANPGTYDGTTTGATINQTGQIDKCYSFDGLDDYVAADPADWTATAYTVALWVKAGVVFQAQWTGLFNNDSAGSDFQIDVDGTDPGNYRSAGNGNLLFGAVTTDWVHLAVTWNGATVQLYYNGAPTNSVAKAPGTAGENFGVYEIGRNRGDTIFFNGLIDDVRVYDRDLLQSEIQVLAGVVPEINVQGNGNNILSGDITPQEADGTHTGETPVGTPVSKTFTIQNLDAGSLTLTDSPTCVALTGGDAAEFTVTVQPTSPIAGSGSDTFTVRFDAASAGTFTTTVSIANNDSDEDPYTFYFRGWATTPAPEITPISGARRWGRRCPTRSRSRTRAVRC